MNTYPISSSSVIRWAWVIIAILAIASRLGGLGATPLTPIEATRAVAAWDAAAGEGWPAASDTPGTNDSVALLVGNALLFTLFRPTPWVARLLPALAGIAVVGLPFLWRRELGELGALTAAGLLLVSPLSLLAAHRVAGASLAVLGAGLLVTAWFAERRRVEGRERLMAAGLALGLTGGAAFYDAFIAAAGVGLILRRIVVPKTPRPQVNWQRATLLGLAIAVWISIAGGWRWSGWSGVLNGAGVWLRQWQTATDRDVGVLNLVLLYEPVLVIGLLLGLGWLVAQPNSRRQRAPWIFALLGVLSVGLAALRPGSTPEGLSWTSVPLALLCGWVATRLWAGLTGAQRQWMGLHILVAAVFWVPGLLALAQHARGMIGADQGFLVVLGFLVLLGLQALLGFIFMMQLSPELLWRSALMGFVAIVLFLQMGFGVRLAMGPGDQSVEPAISIAGSRDMASMADMIARLAVHRNERRDSLPVVLLDRDAALIPTLRWAVRDFTSVTVASDWPADPKAIVIAPETLVSPEIEGQAAWRGMRFVAATRSTTPLPRCRLLPPACSEVMRWYLYRTPVGPATPTNVVLWESAPATP